MLLTESQLEKLIEFNTKSEYYNILFEDAKKIANEVLSDFFKEEKERIKLKLFLEGYSDEVIEAYVSPYDDNSHLLSESFFRDVSLGFAQMLPGIGRVAGLAGVAIYGKEFMEYLEKDEIFSTIFSALGFIFSLQAIFFPNPIAGTIRGSLSVIFQGVKGIITGAGGLAVRGVLRLLSGSRGIAAKIFDFLGDMLKGISSLLKGEGGKTLTSLADKFGGRDIMTRALQGLSKFSGKLTTFFTELSTRLPKTTTEGSIRTALKDSFEAAFPTVKAAKTAIDDAGGSVAKAAGKAISKQAGKLMTKLVDKIRALNPELIEKVAGIVKKYKILSNKDLAKTTFQTSYKLPLKITNIDKSKDIVKFTIGGTPSTWTTAEFIAIYGDDLAKALPKTEIKEMVKQIKNLPDYTRYRNSALKLISGTMKEIEKAA